MENSAYHNTDSIVHTRELINIVDTRVEEGGGGGGGEVVVRQSTQSPTAADASTLW